jgi:hypothetical protein
MCELRRHQRESPSSPLVSPLSAPGFFRLVERAVAVADPGIKTHAHMLHHPCGCNLPMMVTTPARSRHIWVTVILEHNAATLAPERLKEVIGKILCYVWHSCPHHL